MKKRDRFWVNKILLFALIVIIFMGLSLYNIVQFNDSYIKEEHNEINVFKKQIEWVIKPFLKTNDYNSLNKYVKDFETNDDVISFQIFNSDKKLLASTDNKNDEILNNKYKLLESNYSKWKTYTSSLKAKNISEIYELNIDNKKFYLELTVSQKTVIYTIIKAQKNLLFFFVFFLLIMSLYLLHASYQLRKSFNQLEDSVIEIANGNLEAVIEIPKISFLEELTISIRKMRQQLKKQIEKLIKLEQYRTNFIQSISHEIKTPITAINSAIELLKTKNSISKEDSECFNIILFQTKSINKLVNDILQLEELEVNKTEENAHFEKFDLNDALKKTISYFKTSKTKIDFIENDKVHIIGNEDFIITAVSNLLTNALRYSQSEKIDVILSKINDFARIEVKDYGIGIEQAHLDKIFERFYRVNKDRSRKTGGTGLGLSIVKSVIELHKGTIEVTSRLNEGTNFIIKLPQVS